jgi:hypothetical protein
VPGSTPVEPTEFCTRKKSNGSQKIFSLACQKDNSREDRSSRVATMESFERSSEPDGNDFREISCYSLLNLKIKIKYIGNLIWAWLK